MYQALLTRRYLTSKVMPLLASFAVLLCVATELIVWSVMGGFLTMLLSSGRMFIGDVSISWPNTGFAHYGDLVQRLEADPRIAAAAPTIETYGMMKIPPIDQVETVMIKGIEPESFDRVAGYYNTLYWKPVPPPKGNKPVEDFRADPKNTPGMEASAQAGRRLAVVDPELGREVPAVVPGIEVSGYNERMPGGWIDPRFFLPFNKVTIGVFPLDRKGGWVEPVAAQLPVANEFRTMFYDADANVVLIGLDKLQSMLHMDEAKTASAPYADIREDGTTHLVTPEPKGTQPARVTAVLVRGKNTDSPRGLAELKRRCAEVYAEFAAAHPGEVPSADSIMIRTWEDRNSTLVGAVKKEIGLVMFIFGVIALTSVFLVLAIFWSMVSEKTRDIGVLRALGASRAGVAWLWVRYGLAIGLVGSILGLGAALLIVTNINPIHDWLGRTTASLFGEAFYIWDPRVYVFTEIPHDVDPLKAAIIFVSGVLASTVGALIPAARAARMRPVQALRFE
ncbi:MAG: ABC transporter permease [Phycisphaerales bacterium]